MQGIATIVIVRITDGNSIWPSQGQSIMTRNRLSLKQSSMAFS